MREEVQNVLSFIKDSLLSQGVPYSVMPDDDNPDATFIISVDRDGYENFGVIGWNAENGAVAYAAYDPVRGRHDEMEGVPEDQSKCWWQPKDAEMMVMFLDGRVRKVIREEIARNS